MALISEDAITGELSVVAGTTAWITEDGSSELVIDVTNSSGRAAEDGAGELSLELDPPAYSMERWAPDAIISQSNLVGVVAVVQDDPDSETGTWLTLA